MEDVKLQMESLSPAQVRTDLIMQEFEEYIAAADLGYYPPPALPAAVLLQIAQEHDPQHPVDQQVREQIQEQYAALHAKAAVNQQGLLSEAEVQHKVLYRMPFKLPAPAAAPIAIAQPGDPNYNVNEALLQQLVQMTISKQQQSAAPPEFLSVGARAYTPQSAVMLLFWIALDSCFALAGEELVPEFCKLVHPGAQGKMHIREFQLHVQRLFSAVRHLTVIGAHDDVKSFKGGLNNASSREFAVRYHEANLTCSLDQLALAVQQHEARELDDVRFRKTVEAYGGRVGSSSRRAADTAATDAAGEGKFSLNNPRLLGLLDRCDPDVRVIYEAAAKLSIAKRDHPKAMCRTCFPCKHTNESCPKSKTDSRQEPAAAVAMAAAAPRQPAAAVQPAAVEQLGMVAAGVPRSEVRPFADRRGGRGGYQQRQQPQAPFQQQQQQQQHSDNPCRVCGYYKGHMPAPVLVSAGVSIQSLPLRTGWGPVPRPWTQEYCCTCSAVFPSVSCPRYTIV
jgi:hypothetical protein